ncbi:MAG: hypothetical protein AAF787_00180 [Chloroflexota bacterium]
MAALSITAANVLPGTGAINVQRTGGTTLTAGVPAYADSTDSFELKPAANTSATLAAVVGIILQGVGDGQPVLVQIDGTIDGVGATEGVVYVLGAAGEIVPVADLVATNFVTLIGVGNADGGIDLSIKATGSQVQ